MDNQPTAPKQTPVQLSQPRQFMDVTRPGGTAASPSGRPVIVGNKTVQNDPMMTPHSEVPLAPAPVPVVPPLSAQAPLPAITSAQSPQLPGTKVAQPAEPLHKLKHENAFFGHVGSHQKSKKWILLVVVLILSVVGGCGAWVLINKKPTTSSINTSAPVATDSTKKSDETIPPNFTKYENKELGLSFSYPKEWGVPNIKVNNESNTPSNNDTYYTFSFLQPEVDVTILKSFTLTGGRDGQDECDIPPTLSRSLNLESLKTTTVGWKGENLLYLFSDKVKPSPLEPEYMKISNTDKTLVYKENNPEIIKPNPACKFTQANADEANTYNDIRYYVVNLSQDNYKGANAQYWTGGSVDEKVSENISTLLTTIKKI